MKYCGHCGASIADSALSFYPECGERLVSASKLKAVEPVKSKKLARDIY